MALQPPVAGARVTQGFGPSARTDEPRGYGSLARFSYNPLPAPFRFVAHWHPAIDLAAPEGTPIVAPEAGLVTAAGVNGSSGLRINVQIRPGTKYGMGHMRDLAVKVGDRVKRGQLLGHVGHTGSATGPHAHFFVEAIPPSMTRPLLYDPRLFFVGGANANDPRIRPV